MTTALVTFGTWLLGRPWLSPLVCGPCLPFPLGFLRARDLVRRRKRERQEEVEGIGKARGKGGSWHAILYSLQKLKSVAQTLERHGFILTPPPKVWNATSQGQLKTQISEEKNKRRKKLY